MKIITVVGARPQFIKAATISRALTEFKAGLSAPRIDEIIIHTGQHFDEMMSDVFFEEMHIPKPKYNLQISGNGHGVMTGRMLEKIEEVLIQEKPNVVLVYGDTNSTLAGALAAAKLNIPVAHVEAGLRSFNMRMPEEINRILTDRVSSMLFCPTDTAVANLRNEGYFSNSRACQCKISNVGDVMCDASLFYQKIARPSKLIASLAGGQGTFYLATIHRAENTDDAKNLSSIISALDQIARKIPVILPIHPRTRKAMDQQGIHVKNISVTDPVGYFDMIYLLKNCQAVFTDSGGVQKEAFFFRKPCITLREETEWTELVGLEVNCLVGAKPDAIVEAETQLSLRQFDFSSLPYGEGHAGEKIVSSLTERFA